MKISEITRRLSEKEMEKIRSRDNWLSGPIGKHPFDPEQARTNSSDELEIGDLK